MGFQFAERSSKCNRRPPKLVPLPRKFQLLEPEFKEYFSLARKHPGIDGFQKVIDRACLIAAETPGLGGRDGCEENNRDAARALGAAHEFREFEESGRASGRERVGQHVVIKVV